MDGETKNNQKINKIKDNSDNVCICSHNYSKKLIYFNEVNLSDYKN